MGFIPHTVRQRRHRIRGTVQYVVIVHYHYPRLDWNVWVEFSSKTMCVCFRTETSTGSLKDPNGAFTLLPPQEKLCARTEVIQLPESVILDDKDDMEVSLIDWTPSQSHLERLQRENLDPRYLQRLEFKFRIGDKYDLPLTEEEETSSRSSSPESDSSDSSMLDESDEEYDRAQPRTSESEVEVGESDFKEVDSVGATEEEEDDEDSSGGPEDELEMTLMWERSQLLNGRRQRSPSPELEHASSKRRLPEIDVGVACQRAFNGAPHRWASLNNALASTGVTRQSIYEDYFEEHPSEDADSPHATEMLMDHLFRHNSSNDPDYCDTATSLGPGQDSGGKYSFQPYQDLGLLSSEALELLDNGMETDDERDLSDVAGATENHNVDPSLLNWADGVLGE